MRQMKMKYIGKVIFMVLVTFMITSCNKKYQYIVTIEKSDPILGGNTTEEREPEEISAPTDSAAYCQAYQKFCISLKVEEDMIKKGAGSAGHPKDFQLINAEGSDIAITMHFANMDVIKDSIKAHIFGMENLIVGHDSKQEDLPKLKASKEEVPELKTYFNIKKDEFDENGTIWYKPKSCPKFINANGIYLYFGTIGDKTTSLRFCIQYEADEWLFIQKIAFNIDGKAYSYTPMKMKTDSGNGGRIWEWFDDPLENSTDKALIYALANAKKAKMKFIGKQYYDTKTITSKQILDIKRTIELYNGLGGNY